MRIHSGKVFMLVSAIVVVASVTAQGPLNGGDPNCDGANDIGDLTYTVDYMFRGGPAPCELVSSGWIDAGDNVHLATATDRVLIGVNPINQFNALEVVGRTFLHVDTTTSNLTSSLIVQMTNHGGGGIGGSFSANSYGGSNPTYGVSGWAFDDVGKATGLEGNGIIVEDGTAEARGVFAKGYTNGTGDAYGVKAEGTSYLSGDAYGGKFVAYGTIGTGTHYGIYAGVEGAGTKWAGYFAGNVRVTGTLDNSKNGIIIDHPLDPENRFLRHSNIGSPDMMNVYNGNVILDGTGEATVTLPDYFESFNTDYRYQLTCIGGFAPVYVAEKIEDNQFRIAGGAAGLEVSWQVTGVRRDAYAQANVMEVEVDKLLDERGKYLSPEAFGMGLEYGIDQLDEEEIVKSIGIEQ